MKKPFRIWSALLALILSLAVICAEMPLTAHAASYTIHLRDALSHSNWGTYEVTEGDTVSVDLEKAGINDANFYPYYHNGQISSVEYKEIGGSMYKIMSPDNKGLYNLRIPMGTVGQTVCFRIRTTGDDYFISDEYTIKEQPDLNMKTKVIDLRNGEVHYYIDDAYTMPNGFEDSTGEVVMHTLWAAEDEGIISPFNLKTHDDEDPEAGYEGDLDLDMDGKNDIHIWEAWGESENIVITRLDTSKISGDYSIKLSAASKNELNCRYRTYFSTLTFQFGYSMPGAKVTLKTSTYTYDGKAKKPEVTVKCGSKTLTKGTDYTVTYKNNKNAGKATVTIKGKGNGFGTISKTFTIKPKAVTPKVTLSAKAYTYDGKVKKPTVTVKVGTKTLASDSYTVTYASGRKNVGSYKVTVKLKGNYSGSKAVSFKIDPKGTTLNTLSGASKAITVKWKKQAAKMAASTITGYEIQLATDSAFTKNVKKVTVSGYTKVSKKVTSLLGAKTYYVRVRTYKTVDSTKYYSDWSAAKTVKTKK